MAFRRGQRVEIASKEEGFVGSYYKATIVEKLEGDKYRVKYKTLVTDDYSEPLQEIVEGGEVRPPPHIIPKSRFFTGEMVDAYDNDGWWHGIVVGENNGKYAVHFHASSQDVFEYPANRLRVHKEWIQGLWVCYG